MVMEWARIQELNVSLVTLLEELDFFLAVAVCRELNAQVTVCIVGLKALYSDRCF